VNWAWQGGSGIAPARLEQAQSRRAEQVLDVTRRAGRPEQRGANGQGDSTGEEQKNAPETGA
jgi:hypothetical protein